MPMLVRGDADQKPESIFARLLFILACILIPIGAFLFPIFIFELLIYHEHVAMMGVLEFIFVVVPLLSTAFARAGQNENLWIIIKLFIFGLFLFAVFFAVNFVKVLPLFFGAMG
jgi:hypothetical protein